MLDDKALEGLIRQAGTRLDPPADGASRILESTPHRKLLERHTKLAVAVGVVAVAAVTVAALSSASGGSSHRASSGSSPAATRPASTNGASQGAAIGTTAGSGTPSAGPSAAGSAPAAPALGAPGTNAAAAPSSTSASGSGALPNVVAPLPTRVIKTGTVDLQVPIGRAGDTLSRISSQAATLQGFVTTSSIENTGSAEAATPAPASGAVTVRVPVGSFEAMVSFVQKLGTPTSVTTSGQDVTSSYVDLQARIASLQSARSQFEQILARATSIGDILSVENQINDAQTQIEQLQGQLNVMTDQTSFSTLTVNVSEKPKPGVVVPPPRPAGGLSKAWDHARSSFVHGVEAVIGASGGIAVFLLFAGLALVVGRYGLRTVRRRLV